MLSLYWYKNQPNFGDAFSPMAVEHCFGIKVKHGGKWNADMVAEGSVLDFTLLRDRPAAFMTGARISIRAALNRRLRRPLTIWGSGMLYALDRTKVELPIRRPNFLALRGELTRREMIRLGLLDEKADIALGDPGLFMPEVFGIVSTPQHNRGLVLHACSWKSGEAAEFAKEHPDIFLIDPQRAPEDVVRDIASCREICSSSLHGLVVADALGIPNQWIELDTGLADSARTRFKFDDYYSAFGVRRNPCTLRDAVGITPSDPISSESIRKVCVDLQDVAKPATY